jgi:hypothetical protein
LFILLAVATGLSAGIGAVELAGLLTVAFTYTFLVLWMSEYGERSGMKRYLSDYNPATNPDPVVVAPVVADVAVVVEPENKA